MRKIATPALFVLEILGVTAPLGAGAATLPVPCTAGTCNTSVGWTTPGSATAVQSGNALTVMQAKPNVVLNWQSFNISADGSVTFKQPGATSIAINQIFQGDPSKIMGALSANGSIYLINQNGIVFGAGAQVNTGSLIASSLNLTPEALSGILQAVQANKPAFQQATDANGNLVPSSIDVQAGASLSAPGGQILLLAPKVTNEGTVRSDGGQVVLAAGDSVYVAGGNDPNLRGLVVQVGNGGTVTNAVGGAIAANEGNVSLVGLIVNQLGRISATTSVRANGSIYLLAQDHATTVQLTGTQASVNATEGGKLTLGPGSQTDISLALSDPATTVDATPQPKSTVTLFGQTVSMAAGSEITAPSGNVSIGAAQAPIAAANELSATAGSGRLEIDAGAKIDVSGADIDLPAESNIIAVQLRGTELADSPLQRNGSLRGQTVYIDVRQSGTNPDGSTWFGSAIGDLSGYVAAVPRTVGARSLTGGTISLQSDGGVFVASGANFNVSGGVANYASGYINTSKVLGTNGTLYDISQASPTQTYSGVVNNYTFTDPKWGVTQQFPTFGAGRFEPGYVQGYDAGSVTVIAPASVLDGAITASVVAGALQRQLPGAIPTDSTSLYRPINQIPLGGQLIIGVANPAPGGSPNYVTPAVTFADGNVLSSLTGPTGAPFDPLTDPLPAALDTVQLNPSLFGVDGVANLSVFANGAVTLPANVSLKLPAGGSIALRGASVNLAGSIDITSGTVSALAGQTISLPPEAPNTQLLLSPTADINVSGMWVNDMPTGSTLPGTEALAIKGGSVTLSASDGRSMDLEQGSVIDVSAGVQRTAAGQLVGGQGGSIAISVGSAGAVSSVPVTVASNLRGFALQSGGRVSLKANTVCIAAANCAGDDDTTLWVSPELFSRDGFAQISLASNFGGLSVAPDTTIVSQQLNYQFSANTAPIPTGTPLASFAAPALLPDFLRKPTTVSLATSVDSPLPFTAATFATAGELTVGHDASISVDPGGTLSLTSNSSIVIDGTLSAPAGTIAVTVNNSMQISEFIPNQGVWLLDGAHLSAPGAAQVRVSDSGQRTGTVLNGGTISVEADRGYLFTDPLSTIDASGTAATIDIASSSHSGQTTTSPSLIGSSGGTVSLAAAEGLQAYGAIDARAGAAQGVSGGTLNITLDGNLHGNEPAGTPVFPLGPRELLVSDSSPNIFAPGVAVPDVWNGIGRIPAATLQNGGFGTVQLAATDLYDASGPNSSGIQSTGSIVFARNVSLTFPGTIRLASPELVSTGGANVSLTASYIGVGSEDTQTGTQAPAVLSPGTGTLSVSAGLVDLIGSIGLSGFSSAQISSTGDIRGRGIETVPAGTGGPASPPSGELQTLGSLTLSAAQIYPTTLSQYSIVVGGADSTLTVSPGNPSSAAPLSAGGSLTLQADTINQQGVLRAPFGQIVISGTDVTLAAGSVTSTSGAGLTVPFGSTQAGVDWVYPLPLGQIQVYTNTGPPSKSIELQADHITAAKGSVVDVSGGGDLQAYEFIPGTTGTNDVLGKANGNGQFAILPQSALAFAPYDSQSSTGFPYAIGTTITLAAGSGVAAGTYAVLPARYALLPGAYLVTPVSGYTDLTPGQTIAETIGGPLVAGQLGSVGTGITQPRTAAYQVTPGQDIQQLALYSLTSANTFFNSIATAANVAAPPLPVDAGQLKLLAGSALQFLGTLSASPATGGRGAEVDISATNIEITSTDPGSSTNGAVLLSASQINSLGAQSLLIGGVRSAYSGTVAIDTTADTVTVDSGVALANPELLLTANNDLSVQANASLTATGKASTISPATEFDLASSGAFVRVSAAAQVPVVRAVNDGSAGTGNLEIAQGAVIAASGSALLDASGNLQSAAQYKMTGASLGFEASQITIGQPGPTASAPTGLILDSSALSSLGLSGLLLGSSSSIDINGSNSLAVAGNVTLQSGLIQALTPDASLMVHANSIDLAGTSQPMAANAVASTGSLTLQADSIKLDGGNIQLAGFGANVLDGASQIRATAAGALSADHALTLATGLLDAGDGINFAFTSADQLAAIGSTTQAGAAAAAPGYGSGLALTGAAVTIDTNVALPTGGLLTVAATGTGADQGVVIGSNANVDLAGKPLVFDGLPVDGRGGRVDINVASGSFSMAQGATFDVSGAGTTGAGGELNISAAAGTATLAGTLTGLAGTNATGGSFTLEALQLPDLAGLNSQLNSGGFTASRTFHQTGTGDVVVASGATIRAANVSLSDDGGAIDLRGNIDATGVNGGSVLLAAANGINVEGSIDVHGTGANATAGRVQLDTAGGGIELAATGAINLGVGGSLDLRLPRTSLLASDGTVAPQIGLNGKITGGSLLQIEGFQAYVSSGVISDADTDPTLSQPLADATAFMSQGAAIGAAVGAPAGLAVSVVPGIEIDSLQDLTVASDWNLNAWRPGGVAGILTLRAAGNLNIQKSISDGFTAITGDGAFTLPDTPDQSWSYRLVAGALLGASNPLAVIDPSALPSGSGNIVISAGRIDTSATRPPAPVMIRTGTGSIDIAAAGDLTFGNRASVIYTAGNNSNAGIPLANLANLAYPSEGGDINIQVGGNVIGAPTNQLVNSWLWRTGEGPTAANPSATGWTVNYQWFEESVGALGGGNVNITAGGDVRELSVAIPTIGVQVGGTDAASNSVDITGGGQLTVESGGSILGGSFYVGRGTGQLTAWNSVGADTSGNTGTTGLAPILALGDATLSVTGRDGAEIAAAVNPTLLSQAKVQPTGFRTVSYFSTYTDQSAVSLTASAGDVDILNDPADVESQLTSISFNGAAAAPLSVYPGTLNAAALAGDVHVGGTTVLWPSPVGNLNLLARHSVLFDSDAPLLMADIDPATLPSPMAPSANLQSTAAVLKVPVQGVAHLPIHSAAFSPTGEEDPNPVRIVALGGDVVDANLQYIPKETHIVAGGDVTGLSLRAENVGNTDESVVSAGGDVVYGFPRDPISGIFQSTLGLGIVLEGPGSLLVTAGHSINLGTADGITTVGNLYNPSNAASGADVTLLAGVTPDKADISDFVKTYLASSDVYDALLLSYVNARSSAPVVSKADALQEFNALPLDQQFALCQQIFLTEVRLGGESAAAAGPQHDDYSRSFLALSTLFPGSTDLTATGAKALYPGSISLYFSRIYTLAGGDITLLAPGGSVDVGISTAPVAFGLSKQASDLGLVAQSTGNVSSVSFGDFSVNESRVFAADGGNILVWSTDGNVDAGRGAKTAISAPPPTITFNDQGQIETVFPAALQGSGIQALAVSDGVKPGNVDLFAPDGVVNAGDAGIVAGNLTIGATAVLGRDNITVSGVSVGVPVESTGLGASVVNSTSAATSSANVATAAAESGTNQSRTPIAETATAWLDVFLVGLGEENCKPEDTGCLKRQSGVQ